MFGFDAASLGDINGDSYLDLAIGAPGPSGSAGGVRFVSTGFGGAVLVAHRRSVLAGVEFSRGNSMADFECGRSLTSWAVYPNSWPEPRNKSGLRLASSADAVRYPHLRRLAIGCPRSNAGGANTGQVHIVRVTSNFTLSSEITISSTSGGSFSPSIQTGGFFGSSMASLGNNPGSSSPMLAVGSAFDASDGGHAYFGAVFVLHLDPDTDEVVRHVRLGKTQVQGHFGAAAFPITRFGRSVSCFGPCDWRLSSQVHPWRLEDRPVAAALQQASIRAGSGTGTGIVQVLLVGAQATAAPSGSEVGSFQILALNAAGGIVDGKDYRVDTPGMPSLPAVSNLAIGTTVLALPDYDGNGVLDLVVSVPGHGSSGGSLFVLLLLADGSIEDHTNIAPAVRSFFTGGSNPAGIGIGSALVRLDSINGDSIADIAIGLPFALPDGTTSGGAVVLASMNGTGSMRPVGSVEAMVTASAPEALDDGAGYGLAMDILVHDEYGHDVLIVGAPYPNSSFSPGAVYAVQLFQNGSVRDATDARTGFNGATVLNSGDGYGSAVASVGDVDGDGIPDAAASAPRRGTNGSGTVFVLLLHYNRTIRHEVETADLPFYTSGDQWGASMAALDIDGDGLLELAIGCGSCTYGDGSASGGVALVWIAANGVLLRPAVMYPTHTDGSLLYSIRWGLSIGVSKDLDSDGRDELLLGSPMTANMEAASGAAWFVFMRSNGSSFAQSAIASDGVGGFNHHLRPGDMFGHSFAWLGPVDATDEIGDIAVGAPGSSCLSTVGSNRLVYCGAVWLLFMQASGRVRDTLLLNPATFASNGFAAPAPFMMLGESMSGSPARSSLGTGTGSYSDQPRILLGFPREVNGSGMVGKGGFGVAQLIRRTPDSNITNGIHILASSQLWQESASHFGSAIHRLGVTADGADLVAVGAKTASQGPHAGRGAVHILRVSGSGELLGGHKIPIPSTASTSAVHFGNGLSSFWQPHGDYPHLKRLVVGAPLTAPSDSGAVWVLRLGYNGTLERAVGLSQQTSLSGAFSPGDFGGFNVQSLGDLDGDGLVDIAVGARGKSPSGGILLVYLEKDDTARRSLWLTRQTHGLAGLDDMPVSSWGVSLSALLRPKGHVLPRQSPHSLRMASGSHVSEESGEVATSNYGAVTVFTLHENETVSGLQVIANGRGGLPDGFLPVGARFGVAVEFTPDLNGDGTDDLFVGGHKYQIDGSEQGAMFVLLLRDDGSCLHATTLTAATEPFVLGGTVGTGLFGIAFEPLSPSSLGHPRVAVGCPYCISSDGTVGTVHVLELAGVSPSSKDGDILATAASTPGIGKLYSYESDATGQFGLCVGSIPGFDKDATSVVLVGCLGSDYPSGSLVWLDLRRDGRIARASTVNVIAGAESFGMNPSDKFGKVSVALGLSADGGLESRNVLVTAPGRGPGQAYSTVLSRNGSAMALREIDLEGTGDIELENGDLIGFDAAVLSFAQDSVKVALGAPGRASGGASTGAVIVVTLHESGWALDAVEIGSELAGLQVLEAGAKFGYSVAACDVDWDGVGDLIVGQPLATSAGANIGAIWILMLDASTSFVVNATQLMPADVGIHKTSLSDAILFGQAVVSLGRRSIDNTSTLSIAAPYQYAVFVVEIDAALRARALVRVPPYADRSTGLLAVADSGPCTAECSTAGSSLDRLPANGRFAAGLSVLVGNRQDGSVASLLASSTDSVRGEQRLSGTLTAISIRTSDIFPWYPPREQTVTETERTPGNVLDTMQISEGVGGLTAQLEESDEFGTAVCVVGDISGDGYIDLAVGAPASPGGGSIYVLFLRPFTGTVNYHTEISQSAGGLQAYLGTGARFGESICHIHDVDLDGVPDIAVGAPGATSGGHSNAGLVVLLMLHSNGTVKGEALVSSFAGLSVGQRANARFGIAMHFLDLDDDGVGELLVGMENGRSSTDAPAGSVVALWLHYNGTVTRDYVFTRGFSGFEAGVGGMAKFGSAITDIGRPATSSTGFLYLVVGASRLDQGATDQGAIYTIGISRELRAENWTRVLENSGDFTGSLGVDARFGSSLTALGDIDDDRVPDVAVGSPRYTFNSHPRGAVWILFFRAVGETMKVKDFKRLIPEGATVGLSFDAVRFFGRGAASWADLDGDSRPDLYVGGQEGATGLNRGSIWRLSIDALEVTPRPPPRLRNDDLVTNRRVLGDAIDSFSTLKGANSSFGGGGIAHFGVFNTDAHADVFCVGLPWAGALVDLIPFGAFATVVQKRNGTVSQTVVVDEETMPTWVVGGEIGASIAVVQNSEARLLVPYILVGAPASSKHGEASGEVYMFVLHQNYTLRSAHALHGSLPMVQPGDRFGAAVSFVDIDHDGRSEILVGSPGGSGSLFALVVSSNVSTVLQFVELSAYSSAKLGMLSHGGLFGSSAYFLGLRTTDGSNSIAVGAPSAEVTGRVYLMSLSKSIDLLEVASLSAPTLVDDRDILHRGFGYCVAAVQQKHSGTMVVAVSSPDAKRAGSSHGIVWLFEISGTTLDVLRVSRIDGATSSWLADFNLTPSPAFGSSLASVPDWNGDGMPDLVIGHADGSSVGSIHFVAMHGERSESSATAVRSTSMLSVSDLLQQRTRFQASDFVQAMNLLSWSRIDSPEAMCVGLPNIDDDTGAVLLFHVNRTEPSLEFDRITEISGRTHLNESLQYGYLQAGSRFGTSCTQARLYSGKFLPLLVVGAAGGLAETKLGAVWLIWLSTASLAPTQLQEIVPPSFIGIGDRFGASVSVNVNVVGSSRRSLVQGSALLAVGAPKHNSDEGAVLVYRILTSSHVHVLNISSYSPGLAAGIETNGRFGDSVAFLGENSAEGTVTLAVGQSYSGHNDLTKTGSVWVFFVDDASSIASFSRLLPESLSISPAVGVDFTRLGRGLGAAGDLDQDGRPDLYIGLREINGRVGHVVAVLLGDSGTAKSASVYGQYGPESGAALYSAGASLVDFGFAISKCASSPIANRVLIGSRGIRDTILVDTRVGDTYSSPFQPSQVVSVPRTSTCVAGSIEANETIDFTAASICSLGSIDGDAFGDIAIGYPMAGASGTVAVSRLDQHQVAQEVRFEPSTIQLFGNWSGAYFGASLAGNHASNQTLPFLAIGSPGVSARGSRGVGAVVLARLEPDGWPSHTHIVRPGSIISGFVNVNQYQFGASLCLIPASSTGISSNASILLLAIGAPGADGSSGVIHLISVDASSLEPEFKNSIGYYQGWALHVPLVAPGSELGSSMTAYLHEVDSGNTGSPELVTLAVGAFKDSAHGNETGSVFVFVLNTTTSIVEDSVYMSAGSGSAVHIDLQDGAHYGRYLTSLRGLDDSGLAYLIVSAPGQAFNGGSGQLYFHRMLPNGVALHHFTLSPEVGRISASASNPSFLVSPLVAVYDSSINGRHSLAVAGSAVHALGDVSCTPQLSFVHLSGLDQHTLGATQSSFLVYATIQPGKHGAPLVQASDRFGASAAVVGNLGDEDSDAFCIGAPNRAAGQFPAAGGVAVMILNAYSGEALDNVWLEPGGTPRLAVPALTGLGFGRHVVSLGTDTAASSRARVAISSYGRVFFAGIATRAVWLVSLASNATVLETHTVFYQNLTASLDATAGFGASLAALDVDGDGGNELAVGCSMASLASGDTVGSVALLKFHFNGTVLSSNVIMPTTTGFSILNPSTLSFGTSISGASIPLANLPGVSQFDIGRVFVGDPLRKAARNTTIGAVWVIHIDYLSMAAARYQEITQSDVFGSQYLDQIRGFGRSVAAMPDLNGDFVEDICIGMPESNDGVQLATGAIALVHLTASGTVLSAQYIPARRLGFLIPRHAFPLVGQSIQSGGTSRHAPGSATIIFGLPPGGYNSSAYSGSVVSVGIPCASCRLQDDVGSVESVSRLASGLGSMPEESLRALPMGGDSVGVVVRSTRGLGRYGDLVAVGSAESGGLTNGLRLLYLLDDGSYSASITIAARSILSVLPGSHAANSLVIGDSVCGLGYHYSLMENTSLAVGGVLEGREVVILLRLGGAAEPILARAFASSFSATDTVSASFGSSIACIDTNSDGFNDLVATGAPTSGGQSGHVELFTVGPELNYTSIGKILAQSRQPNCRSGTSVAILAGVDHKIREDRVRVVIGAPACGHGVVNLIQLPIAGLADVEASPVQSIVPPDHLVSRHVQPLHCLGFGQAVASLGDMNFDGSMDVAVGAPGFSSAGRAKYGAVVIFLLKNDVVLYSSVIESRSNGLFVDIGANAYLGSVLAGPIDIAETGVSSLAVGLPRSLGRGYYGSSDGGELMMLMLRGNKSVLGLPSSGPGSLVRASLIEVASGSTPSAGFGQFDSDGLRIASDSTWLYSSAPHLSAVGSDGNGSGTLFSYVRPNSTIPTPFMSCSLSSGNVTHIRWPNQTRAAAILRGIRESDSVDVAYGLHNTVRNSDMVALTRVHLNGLTRSVSPTIVGQSSPGVGSVAMPAPQSHLAASALAADVDADGVDELIVGEPFGNVRRGAVHILWLNSSRAVSARESIMPGIADIGAIVQAEEEFGASVAWVKDTCCCNVGLVLVGAPGDSAVGFKRGSVQLFKLNTPHYAAKFAGRIGHMAGGFLQPLYDQARFGSGVATLGDFDGTGYAGIAVLGFMHSAQYHIEYGAIWVLTLSSADLWVYSIRVLQQTQLASLSSAAGAHFASAGGYLASLGQQLDYATLSSTVHLGVPIAGDAGVGARGRLVLTIELDADFPRDASDNMLHGTHRLGLQAPVNVHEWGLDEVSAIACIGDANKDGFADLVRVSLRASGGVYVQMVLLNGQGMALGSRAASLNSTSILGGRPLPYQSLSVSVAAFPAAHVSDNVSRLLVGIPTGRLGELMTGQVAQVRITHTGRVEAIVPIQDMWASHAVLADGDCFGQAVAVHDLDGDGILDAIIGAPGRNALNQGQATGSLFVLTFDADDQVQSYSELVGARLGGAAGSRGFPRWGHSIAVLPPEQSLSNHTTRLLIGLPGYNSSGSHRTGAVAIVTIFHGGNTTEATSVSLVSKRSGTNLLLSEGDMFGSSVSCIGPAAGVGEAIVLVGAPGFMNNSGAVWVLRVSGPDEFKYPQILSSGRVSRLSNGVQLNHQAMHFGSSIAALADLDGELLADAASSYSLRNGSFGGILHLQLNASAAGGISAASALPGDDFRISRSTSSGNSVVIETSQIISQDVSPHIAVSRVVLGVNTKCLTRAWSNDGFKRVLCSVSDSTPAALRLQQTALSAVRSGTSRLWAKDSTGSLVGGVNSSGGGNLTLLRSNELVALVQVRVCFAHFLVPGMPHLGLRGDVACTGAGYAPHFGLLNYSHLRVDPAPGIDGSRPLPSDGLLMVPVDTPMDLFDSSVSAVLNGSIDFVRVLNQSNMLPLRSSHNVTGDVVDVLGESSRIISVVGTALIAGSTEDVKAIPNTFSVISLSWDIARFDSSGQLFKLFVAEAATVANDLVDTGGVSGRLSDGTLIRLSNSAGLLLPWIQLEIFFGLRMERHSIASLASALDETVGLPLDSGPFVAPSTIEVFQPVPWVVPRRLQPKCSWPTGLIRSESTEVTLGGYFDCIGIRPLPPANLVTEACGASLVLRAQVCSGAVLLGRSADEVLAYVVSQSISSSADVEAKRGAFLAMGRLPRQLAIEIEVRGELDGTQSVSTAAVQVIFSRANSSAGVEVSEARPGARIDAESVRETVPFFRTAQPGQRANYFLRISSIATTVIEVPAVEAAPAEWQEALRVYDLDFLNGTGVRGSRDAGYGVCVNLELRASLVLQGDSNLRLGSGELQFVQLARATSQGQNGHEALASYVGGPAEYKSLSPASCRSIPATGGASGDAPVVSTPVLPDPGIVDGLPSSHPSSAKAASVLLYYAGNVSKPHPDRESLLVLSASISPTLSVPLPFPSVAGEAVVLACVIQAAHDSQYITERGIYSELIAVASGRGSVQSISSTFAVANPSFSVAANGVAGSSTSTSATVSLGWTPQANSLARNSYRDTGRGWLVCVIAGTTIDAAVELQDYIAGREAGYISAEDIALLPGPLEPSYYQEPLAFKIGVVHLSIQWPEPTDLLFRLPDAVWGTEAMGATVSSPAPGSAASLLKQQSRYISSWNTDPQQSSESSSAKRRSMSDAATAAAVNESGAAIQTAVSESELYSILSVSTRAPGQIPWLGPQIVASGSIEITLVCPESSADPQELLPCLSRDMQVYVGAAYAYVESVDVRGTVATILLPSRSDLVDCSTLECNGLRPVLLVLPPVMLNTSGSPSATATPAPSIRSFQSATNSYRYLQNDATILSVRERTQLLAETLCSSEAFMAEWRTALQVHGAGSRLGGCLLLAPSAESDETSPSTTIYARSSPHVLASAETNTVALALRGGIEYVDRCVGFPQPGGLCSDREAVRAGLVCAFGAGDYCRPCPVGAVCPGGFKAQPLPGYWTKSYESGLVLRCEAPATERCLGWEQVEEVSKCGPGYYQGSPACSLCEDGMYPLPSGRCELCPTSPSAWLLVQPVLLYAAGVAVTFTVLVLAVGLVARLRGLSLKVAAKRTAQFCLYAAALLQTVAYAGRAVSPGLPDWYYGVIRMLDVFRFESSAIVHPSCVGGLSMSQEILVLVFATLVCLAGYFAFWYSAPSEPWSNGRFGNGDRAEKNMPSSMLSALASQRSSLRFSQQNPIQRARKAGISSGLYNATPNHHEYKDSVQARYPHEQPSNDFLLQHRLQHGRVDARAFFQSRVGLGPAYRTLTRGDASSTTGMAARAMLTITALVYAIVCSTVVQVFDCRKPDYIAAVVGNEHYNQADEFSALRSNNSSTFTTAMLSDVADIRTNASVVSNLTNSQPSPAQVILASFGHDPDDGSVLLLASDPTILCFGDTGHILAVIAGICAMIAIIAGLPAFLLVIVSPEIDRVVRLSPTGREFDDAMREWQDIQDGKQCLRVSSCCNYHGKMLYPGDSSGLGRRLDSPVAVTSGPVSHDSAALRIPDLRARLASMKDRKPGSLKGLSSAPSMGSKLKRDGPRVSVSYVAGQHLRSKSAGLKARSETRQAEQSLVPSAVSKRGGNVSRGSSRSVVTVRLSSFAARNVVETIRDRSLILRQTNRLAYFADGDYRASAAWIRAVDWAVLLILAALEPLWVPSDPTRTILAGSLQVLVLVAAAVAFETSQPFLEEYQWKRVGKLGILSLSGLAVGLNTIAGLLSHPDLESSHEALQSAAVVMTYLVGIGSIACVSILFVLFWYTLLQDDVGLHRGTGSSSEAPRGASGGQTQQRPASLPGQPYGATAMVTNPMAPSSRRKAATSSGVTKSGSSSVESPRRGKQVSRRELRLGGDSDNWQATGDAPGSSAQATDLGKRGALAASRHAGSKRFSVVVRKSGGVTSSRSLLRGQHV